MFKCINSFGCRQSGGTVPFGLFAWLMVAGGATPASAAAGHFDVAISIAPTHNMALKKGIYSPTGNNAVLNVGDLTSALAAGNLEVTTGNGATGKAPGDIDVGAATHWVSGNTLVLDAYHAIRVNQPVTDAGTGALTLTTDDGGANGHLEFSTSGNIGFWGVANALTINGQSYTLVNSVASLAAAIKSAPGGDYALAANYDAKLDGTYNQSPISTVFEGKLEGLGNAIANVSIRATTPDRANVGFINEIDTSASVSDLRLRNATIRQTYKIAVPVAGILAAVSNGSLYGDETSGSIVYLYDGAVGGLIGSGGGSIAHCSSAARVTSRLLGANYIGGLAGQFIGTIEDSVATGNVTGGSLTYYAGGLVGASSGPIRHSHASGSIRNSSLSGGYNGGLVGMATGPVSNSYARGKVESFNGISSGGLVGFSSASVVGSFATGGVTIDGYYAGAGGLVGWSRGFIIDSYATGTVSGRQSGGVGGLVGLPPNAESPSATTALISSSYSAGTTAGAYAGGFSGNNCDCFDNDYWDTSTSGTTNGVYGGNASGLTGETTQQLQAGLQPGFDPRIWAQDTKINEGLPYLIANPPPQ